jgi:CDP-glucose 4,6-dehydratase
LVVDAIRAPAAGQDISVRHPEAVRPWQHVLEPLAGYLMLGSHLLRPDGETYATGWNFGPRTDLAHPARDVVEGLIRHWGSGGWSPTLSDGRHEAQTLRLSIEKAAHRLGWRPRWDQDETLRRTVDWYRTHADGGGAEALRAMVRAQIADDLALG